MTFIKGHDDPVYPVNTCFTQIFEWRTKNTLFVTIFPSGCTEFTEFPEFSMFKEIAEYFRFVATLKRETCQSNRLQQKEQCLCHTHTSGFNARNQLENFSHTETSTVAD